MPSDATVVVVSKGDQALVDLEGRKAWHFPRDEEGRYVGYHPADGAEAIAHLEELREQGADYLVLPSTAFWWLEYYPELNEHLRQNHRLVTGREECLIFGLSDRADEQALPPAPGPALRHDATTQMLEIAQALLPDDASAAVLTVGEARAAPEGLLGWNFPRAARGEFNLIGHLDALTASGAEFLIVPSTEVAWLERNRELARRLRSGHRLVTRQANVCEIYELSLDGEPSASPSASERKSPSLQAAGPATDQSSQPASESSPTRAPKPSRRSSLLGRVVSKLRELDPR